MPLLFRGENPLDLSLRLPRELLEQRLPELRIGADEPTEGRNPVGCGQCVEPLHEPGQNVAVVATRDLRVQVGRIRLGSLALSNYDDRLRHPRLQRCMELPRSAR